MKNAIQLATKLAVITGILNFHNDRLSQEFLAALSNGKIAVKPTSYILRKEIETVGGTIPLIDSETERTRGASSFSKNILPTDTVLIARAIRLGYDTHASSNKEGQLLYNKAFTPAFRNASLIITQGGSKVQSYPMSELINPYTAKSLKDDYVDLNIPIVLVGGQEFSIEIEFPKVATADINKEYLEIALVVSECTRSAA